MEWRRRRIACHLWQRTHYRPHYYVGRQPIRRQNVLQNNLHDRKKLPETIFEDTSERIYTPNEKSQFKIYNLKLNPRRCTTDRDNLILMLHPNLPDHAEFFEYKKIIILLGNWDSINYLSFTAISVDHHRVYLCGMRAPEASRKKIFPRPLDLTASSATL